MDLSKIRSGLSLLSSSIVIGSFVAGIGFIATNKELLGHASKGIRTRTSGYLDQIHLSGNPRDGEWAKKISKGGYILHFRHAERDKWIDVETFDALESDVHNNGPNNSRYGEKTYFKQAVCLNERGLIQAKAMGEVIRYTGLPIGIVISSPSCRARQTANLAFGGYSSLNRDLVHPGPYVETRKKRVSSLLDIYQTLPILDGKNSIVSGHNGTILPELFTEGSSTNDLKLEEGGFYVISRDKTTNGLKLEHKFHNFNSYSRQFFGR